MEEYIHYVPNRYLLAILGISHQQFRRSVPASGYVVSVNPPLGRRCHGPGETKVTHLHHTTLRDEDVLWFDVTVDYLGSKRIIVEVVILPLAVWDVFSKTNP